MAKTAGTGQRKKGDSTESPSSLVAEKRKVGRPRIEIDVEQLEKLAEMQYTYDELPEIENLLNVHDEIVYQTTPDLVDASIVRVRGIMERPIEIEGRQVSIPVDFSVGPNWGEMEAV